MKKLIIFLLIINWLPFTLKCEGQDQQLVDSLQRQLENYKASKLELADNVPPLYDTIAANIF